MPVSKEGLVIGETYTPYQMEPGTPYGTRMTVRPLNYEGHRGGRYMFEGGFGQIQFDDVLFYRVGEAPPPARPAVGGAGGGAAVSSSPSFAPHSPSFAPEAAPEPKVEDGAPPYRRRSSRKSRRSRRSSR